MPVTGGTASFQAIIMDEPNVDDPTSVVNGGRIFKMFWEWPDAWHKAGQLVVPHFDRGWDMENGEVFIPLYAYGESLDCVNRLLVAVGDEPIKERYVDIRAVAGPIQGFAV